MSDEAEYVFTFLCHFLFRDQSNTIDHVTIDERTYLCLFTAEHLIAKFCQAHYGAKSATRQIKVQSVGKESLLTALRNLAAKAEGSPVDGLAVDPTPGKQCLHMTFDKAIELVEKS